MRTHLTAGGAHEARRAGHRSLTRARRTALALALVGLSVVIGTGTDAREWVTAETAVQVHADDWPW